MPAQKRPASAVSSPSPPNGFADEDGHHMEEEQKPPEAAAVAVGNGAVTTGDGDVAADAEKQESMELDEEQEGAGDGAAVGNEDAKSPPETDEEFGDQEYVDVNLTEIRKDVQCPICLGIIRKTRTVMECLHRFCRECIDKAMRLGNNECPACRTHCASRRSLRDDPNFDAIIAILYPDIEKYEQEEQTLNDEENERNRKIQAAIAETFRKQSEVNGGKSAARSTSVPCVRRSRRNFRANGQSSNLRPRGRHTARGSALNDSGDVSEANGDNHTNDTSSTDEISPSPDKRQRRARKWPTPRSSPARAAGNDELGCDERDDAGISRENFSTSPLRASWGKNGTRTRHGSAAGSSIGRTARGTRVTRMVECFQNSDQSGSEAITHVCLLPLHSQNPPNLQKWYLRCVPALYVECLYKLVANEASCMAEEVKIYGRKPQVGDFPANSSMPILDKGDLELLAGERCISELHPIFTTLQGNLELVYTVNCSGSSLPVTQSGV